MSNNAGFVSQVAVDKETPVMVESWVESVWKDSCKETVSAVDGRYSSHRCPSLLGVTVSVSQLSRADKDLLRKSIENHGGGYSGVLEMDKTTVLICASPSGKTYTTTVKLRIFMFNQFLSLRRQVQPRQEVEDCLPVLRLGV